jgi:hypothetical protein
MGIHEQEFDKLMPINSLVYVSHHNEINKWCRKNPHWCVSDKQNIELAKNETATYRFFLVAFFLPVQR